MRYNLFILWAAAAAFLFAGCASVSAGSFQPGAVYFLAPETEPDWGNPWPERRNARLEDEKKKIDSEDVELRPGFRRTLAGNFADFGAMLVGEPVYYLLGYPAVCISADADIGQGIVYPFCVIGGFAFAAPVVIVKFVCYDAWDGIGWMLTTEKGKVAYYIENIEDLSESEYIHLCELTGRDFGDVARRKNLLYSWGVADKKACDAWREWWKENRRYSMEDIRARSREEEKTGRTFEKPLPDEGQEKKPLKEEDDNYGYE